MPINANCPNLLFSKFRGGNSKYFFVANLCLFVPIFANAELAILNL